MTKGPRKESDVESSMLFVFIKRHVEMSYHTSGQSPDAPNKLTSEVRWELNGPFSSQTVAEQAALIALGQASCLATQILGGHALRQANGPSAPPTGNGFENCVREALARFSD